MQESKTSSCFRNNQITNRFIFFLKRDQQLILYSKPHFQHKFQVCYIKNANLILQTSLLFECDLNQFIKLRLYDQKVFLHLTLNHLYLSPVPAAYFNQVIHFFQMYFGIQSAWLNLLDVLKPSKHLDSPTLSRSFRFYLNLLIRFCPIHHRWRYHPLLHHPRQNGLIYEVNSPIIFVFLIMSNYHHLLRIDLEKSYLIILTFIAIQVWECNRLIISIENFI